MVFQQTTNELTRPTKRAGLVYENIILTNNLNTTQALDFRRDAGGILLIPAGYTANTLTVYISDAETGSYYTLTESDGTAVTITVTASKAVELPVHLFAGHWIKLVQSANDADPIKIITKA